MIDLKINALKQVLSNANPVKNNESDRLVETKFSFDFKLVENDNKEDNVILFDSVKEALIVITEASCLPVTDFEQTIKDRIGKNNNGPFSLQFITS